MRLFDADGLFFKILSTIADVMEVNLLWIIFSLPIVTIGASTTAAYYVSMKMVKGEEGKIMSQFFQAFKDNFKQSTIVWLIYAVYGYFVINSIFYVRAVDCGKLYTFGVVFVTVIFLFLFIYTFPMIARYKSPIRGTIKNALLVSIRYLPTTILMTIIITIIIIGTIVNQRTLILLFIFGVGGFIYLASCFMVRTFAKLEDEIGLTKTNEENDHVETE